MELPMKDGIDNFFEQYLKTKSIFKDKKIFQPNFIPEEFAHRDEQIQQIAKILAPALKGEKPSNLFIYGKTGTGKTLTASHVASSMQRLAAQRSLPVLIIAINCKLKRIADTEYRLIAELCKQLDREVPATGLPTEEVYTSFISAINSSHKIIILIIDEIDHLVAKAGSGVLYNLTRLNNQLLNAQMSIVGISNDLVFTEQLDPRVRSSLSEEELVFPPYNALQIKAILAQRASLAFETNTITPGVIEKCAAFAAREHGDARRAIDLLRVAGEVAEREGSLVVSLTHLDAAQERMEHDRIEDVAASQPKQYQAVLLSLLKLACHKKDSLFTGEVYELYSRLCCKAGLRPLTQRRVSDIIAEYDMLGIINAKIISKGRYGRTREIQVSLVPSMRERVCSILETSLNLGPNRNLTENPGKDSVPQGEL